MDPKEFSTTSRRFTKRTKGRRCTSEPRTGGKNGRRVVGNTGKYKLDGPGNIPACTYCNPAMALSYQRQRDGPRAIRDYLRDPDDEDASVKST